MQVKISDKHQVVIPKAARKKMRLPKHGGYMTVVKITPTEITYALQPDPAARVEQFAGILKQDWGHDTAARLRKIRDKDWD